MKIQIRSFNGTHTLIPPSTALNPKITAWTANPRTQGAN